MATNKRRRIIISMMTAVLLLSTMLGAASAAPVAQAVRAQEVTGTIPGGQFAEIWLGLETDIQGNDITINSTWDRLDPDENGLGFYILTAEQVAEVLSGGNPAQNNLSTAGDLGPESPANQIGVEFRATSGSYTLIVFNDSPDDAEFTLTATNAFITDGSGNVTAVGVADDMADEEMADEEMADEEMADEEMADEPVADDAVAADDAVVEDEAAEETETETPADDAVAEEPEAAADEEDVTVEPAPIGETEPVTVEAQELTGLLPEQFDQHFFGLVPSVRDGQMTLLFSFNPADSSELAIRSGFWVLEQDDFNVYLNPTEDVALSELAIAAGSGDQPGLLPNQRAANFTASGLGPYTVVVYNNSNVPAEYLIGVEGGLLIDDSGQSLTASEEMADDEMADDAEVTDEAIAVDDEAAADDDTGPTREGEPGGAYTVQSGDTLSLISLDIYGEIGYWEEICSFNELDSCDVLEVGDVIQLPTIDQLGTVATTPAATSTATTTQTEEDAEPAEDTAADTADDATETDAATTEDETATTEAVADETEDADTTTADDATEADATEDVADTTEDEDVPATEDDAAADTAGGDLVEVLAAQGTFETLVNALEEAGLAEALESAGPFTVFAPTDEAFNKLPAGAMDSLLRDPNGYLTQILLFHVLDGEVTSDAITDGAREVTQQGKALGFEVTPDGVKVNGANVVIADLEATNGVIHALDAVILPPTE